MTYCQLIRAVYYLFICSLSIAPLYVGIVSLKFVPQTTVGYVVNIGLILIGLSVGGGMAIPLLAILKEVLAPYSEARFHTLLKWVLFTGSTWTSMLLGHLVYPPILRAYFFQ